MRAWSRATALAVAAFVGCAIGCGTAAAAQGSTGAPRLPADPAAASARLRLAEDARAATTAHADVLREGLAHPDVALRLQAARAVGRLEDAAWLPALAPLLDDPSLEVRAEAAWAVAQSVAFEAPATAAAMADAAARLRRRLDHERDALVRGALTANIGRLPFDTVDALEATADLLATQLIDRASGQPVSSPSVRLGVSRGAHALARRCSARKTTCPRVHALLLRLLDEHGPGGHAAAPAVAARLRRLAALGLHAHGDVAPAIVARLIGDDDAEVRRVGVLAATVSATMPDDLAATLARDPSALVRTAFLRRAGPHLPDRARAALHDADAHVRLAAIDALGAAGACGCDKALAGDATDPTSWHAFAHALVATARSRPDAVADALRRALASPVWQVRMYAARAAAEAGLADVAALRHLARDMHPNVREAALSGLDTLDHRASDDLRREALASGDYQLVLTAARGLEGTLDTNAAAPVLLAALRRLTADGRDTSRDPRLALLDRLAEGLADADVAQLAPWTRDADAVVAERAASILSTRTGRPVRATPQPRPSPLPVPTSDEVARLATRQVVLTLLGHGDVVVRLFAHEAPMNAARFVRQVEEGAWDGLTFHRVEPGFVVQGGSPGANEYMGADAYTRDERGPLSHVRGTVGISTRGRDTGDGQIFVNLVDNPRLDHAYTIIGQVVAGMAHVDALHEGAVIVRARVVEGP